jgi:hypothetical protein
MKAGPWINLSDSFASDGIKKRWGEEAIARNNLSSNSFLAAAVIKTSVSNGDYDKPPWVGKISGGEKRGVQSFYAETKELAQFLVDLKLIEFGWEVENPLGLG